MEATQEAEHFKWFVCHDGSKDSEAAFQVCRWSLMSDKNDHLTLAHVWNAEKNEYLPDNMKEAYIKSQGDTECIALGTRYFFWSQELVKGEATAKELLNEGAKERNSDIIVVGFHGRKGPKEDPTVLGTAVQYLGLHTACPVFILKKPIARKEVEDRSFRFAAAVDGSAESLKSIDYICKMRQEQDRVEVIICEQANISTNHVKDTVMTMLEEAGADANASVTILPAEGGRRSADLIRDYVDDKAEYIDFMFVGNKGADFSSYSV